MCKIGRCLVVLGEQLQPAGIALRQRIGVVVPDVDRRADGAVGDGHHDGKAEAGGVVYRLGHEQQALRGGRGVGARAGRRSADGHRHRGEFRFDVDELARRQAAFLHHPAQRLDDVRLRRNRVGADHLRAAQRHSLGDCPGTFNLFKHVVLLARRSASPPSQCGRPRSRRRCCLPPPCRKICR